MTLVIYPHYREAFATNQIQPGPASAQHFDGGGFHCRQQCANTRGRRHNMQNHEINHGHLTIKRYET